MNRCKETLMRYIGRGFVLMMTAIALTGCGGESEQSADNAALNTQADSKSANGAPTLSGSPGQAANAGMRYSFEPSAADPNGDSLTFSVQNLPSWASFNASNGRLSGTPAAAHVGQYRDIRISVSDGRASASLPAFSIVVSQSSDGRVTLSWNPPQQNTDGSALTDLAGYRILYGTDPELLSESVEIDNPSINTYVVDNLFPATWYFTVKAVATSGRESNDSGVASTEI